MSEPAPTPVDHSPGACLRCGGPIQSMGVEEFRVGGTTGGWKLLVGEWAELGEGMLKLELLACPSCGKVELRAPRPA
ncbi:MAG: nucleotide-binding protein [Chloroflexota bacterium]